MRTAATLSQEIEEALREIPVIDIHTHLVGGKLSARGLHDILLYHMVITDLYSAGCPSGMRLSEYPKWPTTKEAHNRIREALPFLKHINNTSSFWCVRTILKELYDWDQAVGESNWQQLDELIRERADDKAWSYSILDRLRISRSATELARRQDGEDDDRLQYVLEWAMFNRCQWGEFDTALYELERCWGCPPGSPAPIGVGKRQPTKRTISSVEDVREAMRYYVEAIPVGQVCATASAFSCDINYRTVTDEQMDTAISRRATAGVEERDIYASYVLELFLQFLERISDRVTYQFSLGAEPLPYETSSRLPQSTIAQLGDLISRHPRIRFQCFLASRHGNHSLCTLSRELTNLSLAGFWWHNFFPETIRQVMGERLDMLPANRQIGFFSDAYCVEWTYAKLRLVRKIMAQLLAERVQQGQFTLDECLEFARAIFFESPQTLVGMKPNVIRFDGELETRSYTRKAETLSA